MLILAAGLAAAVVPVAGASAQYHGRGYGYDRVRAEQRECHRELRRADSRREYRRELRECRREIARAQHRARERYWDGHHWRWRHRGW
jgi:hypothetical protein